MARKPVVAIVGTGTDSEPAVSCARELGKLIAENGWTLITGGRDAGVMKSASEGAKEVDHSLTVGILPGRTSDVSEAVDVAIYTDTGEARNNIIVISSDVVVACGVGGAGTASEVALALKNEKPVILVGANASAEDFFKSIDDLKRIRIARDPEDAVQQIKDYLSGE